MPRNGDISETFGVFRTACCDAEIVISVGVPFPDCPNHANAPAEWEQLTDIDPNSYDPSKTATIRVRAASRKSA
jgi:hypothetical protein